MFFTRGAIYSDHSTAVVMCLKLVWTAADKQSYDHTDNPESHFERKLDNAKDHVE